MEKNYIFKVGVEAPIDHLDELFEIEIELSQEEHDRIYSAYVDYMWDDDDLSELFRDYLSDFNRRIIGLAESVAVGKWGDAARQENGAEYYVCESGWIEEEYEASEDCKVFLEAKERMRTNCKRQSKYEHDLLVSEHNNGRWPHIKAAGTFDGLFACYRATGGMEAYYCMECQCNGMHIDYCKRYKLRESKMEIRFYGLKTYGMLLIDEYLSNCGREIEIRDMTGHYLVYVPAKEDESDIQILLPILDRLESDFVSKASR
jgi:hypothetical protein